MAIWLWRSAARAARGPVHRYADPHLLPHLTGTRELKTQERWGRFLKWSLLWALLVLAMAGPRWDYTDMRLFHPGNNLLILLDISRSMQVADVAPSRIGRARQEIQDLIMQDRDVRLGLIAFASVPHVVAPVTEDTFTVLNALPALSTDLTELQGSRVGAALERAEGLLKGLPAESSRAILLITDGDFDEPDLNDRVAKLAEEGIRLHVLGIGTEQGARVPAPPPAQAGSWITDRSGKPVVSALNTKLLEGLAAAGQGIYRRGRLPRRRHPRHPQGGGHLQAAAPGRRRAHPRLARALLSPAAGDRRPDAARLSRAGARPQTRPAPPPGGPAQPRGGQAMMPTLRSAATIAVGVAALGVALGVSASWFENSEQAANRIFQQGDYAQAAAEFDDPFRRGVALYRAGRYADAAEAFDKVESPTDQG